MNRSVLSCVGIIMKKIEKMSRLDLEGVERRKLPKREHRVYRTWGPNYVCHIGRYDKLKLYGFFIHGCIEGYSRRMIWLDVSRSNKYPDIIAYYYLKAAKNF